MTDDPRPAAGRPAIDIEVEDGAWTAAEPAAEALALRAAEAVLLSEGADGEHVTLLLTDDAAVRELNARFRSRDVPTNVLSFPAPPNPEKHLGDVALAFGVCAREAAEQGKPLAHHLQHLVAHGVLHLLGYDHMTDAEAEAMEGLERVVLAGLGIPDPYAAGEGDHDRP
jgi:probable rRNA maturation factor